MTPDNQTMTPKNTPDEATTTEPRANEYSFIFAQPNPSQKQKASLKDRFLALSKTKRVAIAAGACLILLGVGTAVLTAATQPAGTSRQATVGTADVNGDGVIDTKDYQTSSGATDDTDTSSSSYDTTDAESDEPSWWQRLLAINATTDSADSNDSSEPEDDTSSMSDSDESYSAANDSEDEDEEVAIVDDSYVDDSDEALPIDTPPSETQVDDPVVTIIEPAPTAKSGTLLTVGSWNILYLNKASQVTKGIKTVLNSAQVVGLQEVGTKNTTANRNAVKNLSSSTVGVYQPKGSTPIIWNAQMYTKKASGYKKISAYGVVKYATYVKLHNKATGQQFYVFNFHAVVGTYSPKESCSTNVCKTYKYEMKALSALIASKKKDNIPIFVTGDYNANYRFDHACSVSWYPCHTFKKLGMYSGYAYTNLAGIAASDSSVGPGKALIDYVFASKRSDVTPVSMQIIAPGASCSTDKSGQKRCWNGSDHKPVLFTVKLVK